MRIKDFARDILAFHAVSFVKRVWQLILRQVLTHIWGVLQADDRIPHRGPSACRVRLVNLFPVLESWKLLVRQTFMFTLYFGDKMRDTDVRSPEHTSSECGFCCNSIKMRGHTRRDKGYENYFCNEWSKRMYHAMLLAFGTLQSENISTLVSLSQSLCPFSGRQTCLIIVFICWLNQLGSMKGCTSTTCIPGIICCHIT